MTPIERLLAKNRCIELMTSYCTHLDQRNEDAFLALFTADATFIKLAPPVVTSAGREAIRGVFNARPLSILSRHMMLNHTVVVGEDGTATSTANGIVVRGTRDRQEWPMPIRGLELVVEYQFAFRLEGEDWRITSCGVLRLLDIEAKSLA
ncbi:nuclear transport factor 2 family protein [Comamonadaceae bacterium G21597-S1]|nr:nuclear transport factor 2 family protein [Comamonadaceae bacterium G21597-S1]